MLLSIKELKEIVTNCFVKIGCVPKVAEASSEALVLSEICGIKTHGLNMVLKHIKKASIGEYNLSGDIIGEVVTNSFARFNANNTIGMYSAKRCMEYAMEKAENSGIYTVFAHHCNTFSAAFVYALQAIQKGMIGIVMSNAPAQMAPVGGKTKLIGTNPIAFAIPTANNVPIILDMSTSSVAKSKIIKARDNNMSIPLGWATDINGNDTIDATKALEGLMLPMAGVKGYGLAVIIDVLSGVLSGAGYLDNVNRFYNATEKCMNVGHVFTCINPKLVMGTSFYEEMDNFINKIHHSSPINEKAIIRLPGENKMTLKKRAEQYGYNVEEKIYEDLQIYLRQ